MGEKTRLPSAGALGVFNADFGLCEDFSFGVLLGGGSDGGPIGVVVSAMVLPPEPEPEPELTLAVESPNRIFSLENLTPSMCGVAVGTVVVTTPPATLAAALALFPVVDG